MNDEFTAEELREIAHEAGQKFRVSFRKLTRTLLRKILVCSTILALITLTLLGLYRALFLRAVDNYELAYTFDRLNDGEITPLLNADGTNKSGYVRRIPFVKLAHTIDLRPMQVCIGANARVLNCKLVQFQAEGLHLFLRWHGRGDYAGPGGGGGGTTTMESTPLSEILKSYAYEGSGKSYPFLKIIRELSPQEVGEQ